MGLDQGATPEQIADHEGGGGALGGIDVYVMNADGSAVEPLIDGNAIFNDELHDVFIQGWRPS